MPLVTQQRSRPGFESPQSQQFGEWNRDTHALLTKLGKGFADLDGGLRAELAGQAREIAEMRSAIDRGLSATARFEGHAANWRRGGVYRGPCRNAHTAMEIGRYAAALHSFKETGDASALREYQGASVSAGTGAAGGYAVPDLLVDEIIRNVEEYGVLERNSPAVEVNADSGSMLKRTGGMTVSHPDIDSDATSTEPTFGRVVFNLTRWATLTHVERWMLDSAMLGALGDFIVQEIAQAMAYSADLYGFMGDGTSTYARTVGVFKQAESDQLIVTADTGDNTFQEAADAHVKYLAELIGAVPKWAHVAGAKFYMHLSIFAAYLGVRLTSGAPVANILGGDTPSPFRLMGYPVEIVQVAPTLTDATQASQVMAVFGALQRGVRIFRHTRGLDLMISEHYRLPKGQISFYSELRQQIVIADNQAFAQLKMAAS